MAGLHGKVAFVTGAARGQGRAHAIRLAREGADILAVDILRDIEGVNYPMASIADRDETIAQVHALGRRIVFEQADVRDLERLQAVVAQGVDRLGRLDVVVANAGAATPGSVHEMSEADFTSTIDQFLTSAWRTIRATAPQLIEQGDGGSIILISSTSGLVGVANMAHYVAAKHGVSGLMKACAIEFGPHDIRVNAVASSNVNTPMIRNSAIRQVWTGDPDASDDDVVRVMSAMHILNVPWVEPGDVSNAVAWLASDDARFVTGSTIPVDAGALAPFKIPHRSLTSTTDATP